MNETAFARPSCLRNKKRVHWVAFILSGWLGFATSAATLWRPPEPGRDFAVLEVLGRPGATATTEIDVPSAGTTLWLEINGLTYPGKVAVRAESGDWVPLRNDTCQAEYPANVFNGIGGPLDTLRVRVPSVKLKPGRKNRIEFRFAKHAEASIGFRVLSVNVLDRQGKALLPPSRPMLAPSIGEVSTTDRRAGSNLWFRARLIESWDGPPILAQCADCHVTDGSDLRYFNFTDKAIIERSVYHGLTREEGAQVASYIRSLPVKVTGTPWDPPYQPGPGLDARPLDEWAAGAGLKWVLPEDRDMWPYIFTNDRVEISFTNTINTRELPVPVAFPDWNSWLPTIHPKDAYGTESFRAVQEAWERTAAATTAGDLRWRLMEWDAKVSDWTARLPKPTNAPGNAGDPLRGEKWHAMSRWRSVKAFESQRRLGFEGRGREAYPTVQDRYWSSQTVFLSSPHFTIQPEEGHTLRDGSRLVWGVRSHQWYWVQLALSGSMHFRNGTTPIDWAYMTAFTSGLNKLGMQNAAQMTVVNIKVGEAMTLNPRHHLDGFAGFRSARLEYVWNREGDDMWRDYSPQFRDMVLRAWLGEYTRMIRTLGRDHFRDISRELTGSETDNTPGAPHAEPWIRSHAGMIRFFRKGGAAPDLVENLREIGRELWPGADWGKL
jgi:hypothetical protein